MKLETMINTTLYVMKDIYHGMKVYIMKVIHNKLIVVEEKDDEKNNPKKREKKAM